ncbi:orotate phosphoribosyltransferase [Methanothermococcus sp. SCGC AD-155-N22]|nr:orotate phosphoribosyltransferase [Methanothermococcus sp. SCGC AD-155-N22]
MSIILIIKRLFIFYLCEYNIGERLSDREEKDIKKLKEELIHALKNRGCIKFGDFILSSGKRSNYYIDIKRAITDPRILKTIAKMISNYIDEELKNENLKIGGIELGSVPIATAVSLETEKELIIIRKKSKDYGTKSKIEGDLKEGDMVILVEDVTTTGGNVIKAVEEIRSMGGVVDRVFVVVDRGEEAKDNLEKIGVKLIPLITVDELM